MLRNRAVALILGLIATPLALALGLGPLRSGSSLNEPFAGQIEIVGATAADFDTLTVGLAPLEQFERAGINLNPLLYKLKFDVGVDGGKDVVKITSREPVREPYLNFLLEINWSNGRLLREYTVLLDPPLYDQNKRRKAMAPTPAPAPSASATPAEVAAPVSTPAVASAAAPVNQNYAGDGEIGPVQATDTLWSLASAYRPDESVTVQQMMLALLRDNPQAFGENNVNLLRRGAILRLPDESSLRDVSASEAFAEVKRQHQLWEQYRGQVSAAPSSQPLGATPGSGADTPAMPAEDSDARLELAAPGGTDSGAASGAASEGDSSLLREELDAQTQQSEELGSKLQEAEEIIDLLQRQVNIKDEELAALQARLAELGIEHGDLDVAAADVADQLALEADADAAAAMVDEAPADEMPADEMMAMEDSGTTEDEPVVTDSAMAEAETVDSAPEPEAEPERQPVSTAPEPAPAAPASFPLNLIPEHIAALVPGGAMTLLGAIAALILGLFAAVVGFLMKSRRNRDDASPVAAATPAAAAVADDDDTDDGADATEDPTITAPTELEDSEAVTEVGATDEEFDPNATIEAESDDEVASSEEEEDPLEEVNVYLAYERFDQAEELVRRVIGEYPDRHEYKLRLLEVHYSSNNRAAYESAAKELHDAVGEDDALWTSAVAMWSEMSPERALFEAGAEDAPEAASDESEAAKAFVDITGDAEDTSGEPVAGEDTVSHAPGGDDDDDGGLDFDLGNDADDGAEDTDGVLDLTAAADDDVLDLTGAGDADDILDITEAATTDNNTASSEAADDNHPTVELDALSDTVDGATADADEDVIDITANDDGADDDDVLDLTEGGEDAIDLTGGDEVFDLTGDANQDDLLDVSAGAGDLLDIDPLGDESETDLLDVTKTGDVSGVEGTDLLNVTSPGLQNTESTSGPSIDETDGGLDLDLGELDESEDLGDEVDFDISDTVADAFDEAVTENSENVLDITEASDGGSDDVLDFDIGGLDDGDGENELDTESTTMISDSPLDLSAEEVPTVDIESALRSEADSVDADSVDLDITMGGDALSDSINVVENEDDSGRLEITMSSLEDEPGGDAAAEEGISLQGDGLDELAGEADEFDFALDGTSDMDAIIADETMDMQSVAAENALDSDEDDASLEALTQQLDSAVDDSDLEILDIEGEATDEEHIETIALDSTDGIQLDETGADEKTVVMPVGDDVEQQSDADEADTKLNLAKAYIELGDTDGARSILDEVAVDGNDEQKAEAQNLLSQL